MKFSPFNPILFTEGNQEITQIFSVSDHIMIECFANISESVPTLHLYDEGNGVYISSLSWATLAMGMTILYYYILRDLPCGCYRIEVGDKKSIIHITESESILSGTTLLQYRNKSNQDRQDMVSLINNVPFFFDFRIPGGFKDADWSFGVENTQFLTEENDVIELSSVDITNKILTLGFPSGVPVWVADMINRIFSCGLVYVDGDRYSRNEDMTPDLTDTRSYESKGVYKIMLRQDHYVDPVFERINRLALRRTPTHLRQSSQSLRKI